MVEKRRAFEVLEEDPVTSGDRTFLSYVLALRSLWFNPEGGDMQHAFNYTKEQLIAMGEGFLDYALRNSSEEKRLEGVSTKARLEGVPALTLLKQALPDFDEAALVRLLEQTNNKADG